MDPLLQLRKALRQARVGGTIGGEQAISLYGHNGESVEDMMQAVYLGVAGAIFPRDVPTNFRSKRGAGDYYPLDAVWFLVGTEMRDASYGEYMQEARRKGLMVISLVDKKELTAYVEEDMAPKDCPSIDLSAPLPLPLKSFDLSEAAKLDQQAASMTVLAAETAPSSTSIAQTTQQAQNVPLTTLPETKRIIKTRTVRKRDCIFKSAKDFSSVMEQAKDLLKSLSSSTNVDGQSGAKSTSATSVTTSTPSPSLAGKQPISLIEQIASANRPAPQPSSSSRPRGGGPEAMHKKGPLDPIIIVPAAPSAPITMHNVRDFLEHGRYLSVIEAKAAGKAKENALFIEHKHTSSGRPMRFQIIDNPTRLALDDWSRIVAVFVQGSLWQFKGWKWENPAELFHHVRGFAIDFDETKPDPTVAAWNVCRLNLSKNRRHLDSTASFQFWTILEAFLKSRRPIN